MIQILDKNGNTLTDKGSLLILTKNGDIKKLSSGGGSPTGPAGGDLSGTYPNPSVVWNNGLTIYNSNYYPLSSNPAGYLTSSSLTGYIPYTGATSNVNLGTYNLSSKEVITDDINFTGTPPVTEAAGKIWYDAATGSFNAKMGGNQITQQIGEESFVYGKASATITDTPLKIIYKTGSVGASGVISFAPTIAGITDANKIIGCATEDIANNAFGRITDSGLIHGIATDGSFYGETWLDDDEIWYNPITGNPTKNKPVAPSIKVSLGTIVHAGAGGSGTFRVEINRGSSLGGTDSNVLFTSLTNNDGLFYESATSLWKNKSIPTILGYTPVTNARTISTTGPLSGGGDLSANRTLSITQATTSTDGYLSSTDWNIFNGKQNSLGFTPENVSNKSDSYTISSSTTYSSTKALVDGLATKQPLLGYTPYRYINSTSTTISTTTETAVATATISGNTFNSNDIMKMLFRCTKGITVNSVTMRIRVNTSNTLVGSTVIATYTFVGTSAIASLQRFFTIASGNLYGFGFTSSQISDIIGISTGGSSTAYNPSNTSYIFFTVQVASGDSVTFEVANITN